jgi:hypothetical protein
MADSEPDDFESDSNGGSPIVEARFSLPILLREVKRDRASPAFAMEKLDQASITLLFEKQRAQRDVHPGH